MDYTEDGPLKSLEQTTMQLQQCRKHLQLSVSAVKTSIHSSFSRLLEMVRSREVFLLNQVDIVQRLSEDAIRAQETSINRAVHSPDDKLMLSNTSSMSSSLLAESIMLDQMLSLQASLSSISFEADMTAIRQAICKFGSVHSLPLRQSLDLFQPVPMTASFTDNSFKEVLDFCSTASTMQDSQTPDHHETETDHDDFVVIAEDENVSVVAGSDEDVNGLTVNATMTMTDFTISEHQTTDGGELLHRDNNGESLVTTEDGSSDYNYDEEHSHLIRSRTSLSACNSNCGDVTPATEQSVGGSTSDDPCDPDNESAESKPFNSELLARLSALPVAHWLIS